MMENNYIALLTLTGLTFQYEWLRTGSGWALALGSAALGANLLTRLTTGMDLLAVGLVPAADRVVHEHSRRGIAEPCSARMRGSHCRIYAVFGLIDRAYQYARFGSFFNTYVQVFGQEWKRLDPSLPAAFPVRNAVSRGIFRRACSRRKNRSSCSIRCLCSPHLVARLLGSDFARRSKPILWRLARCCLPTSASMRNTPSGAATPPGAIVTCPRRRSLWRLSLFRCLLRHRAEIGKAVWGAGLAIAFASVAFSSRSVMFWCPLERYQMETLSAPTFVVWLRLKNIAAFALGKMNAWGLTNDAMKEDPWDYVHITTFNFLPFLLKRVGKAPDWVVEVLTAIWFAGARGAGWRCSRLAAQLGCEARIRCRRTITPLISSASGSAASSG